MLKKMLFLFLFTLSLARAEYTLSQFLHETYWGYSNTIIGEEEVNLFSIKGKLEGNSNFDAFIDIQLDLPRELEIEIFTFGLTYSLYELPYLEMYTLGSISYAYFHNDTIELGSDRMFIFGSGLGIELYITSRINVIFDYRIDYLTDDYYGSHIMERVGFHFQFTK